MADTSPPPYELHLDGLPRLRVHSLSGKETLSEAWSFDVVATCEAGGDPFEQAALGQRATLIFNVGPNPRAFYGIAAAVRLAEVHAADASIKYLVHVVPRLWLLKKKTRTRIFQNLRVTDVVTSVLQEAGITTRWQLTRAYPVREYITQYEETDYRFVKRLLAEAGIYFYFFGGGPVDAAVLAADAAASVAASAGSALAGAVAGAGAGALVGSAVSMAEPLIPGDTVVGADDASCYPATGGDDPAALAASTAAALAPAVADALGVGGGIAGAALGAASAVAGAAIAGATEAAPPVLHFLANREVAVTKDAKLTRFSLRNTVRSSGAAYREYDPDKPAVRLQSKAVSSAPFPPSPLEEAAAAVAAAENVASAVEAVVPLPDAVAGFIDTAASVADTAMSVASDVGAALGATVPYEVYQHHGSFLFPKWAFGNEEAPKILRQKRRRASIASGEGGCSDLSAGHRFALADHPAAQLDGEYVVTGVEHRGETRPEPGREFLVYWNQLECAPASMTYVPPRPKRKSVQVMLTATVVGPAGEEIHVDEKGQIKVQFHWDREGKYDEQSSCWIRVMQPWAGASWGHQFIPRVGMEVVVSFEGGDPDKPMVLGSVYNATHPTAFLLPHNKTKSGIRTATYPGGHGHNEVSFEDRAGKELVYIHAQRDYAQEVLRDRSVNVHGSAGTAIGGCSSERVGVDRELSVGGNRKTTVSGNDKLLVQKSAERHVLGGLRASVAQPAEVTLASGLSLSIGGTHAVHVGGEHGAQSDYYVEGTHAIGAKERIILRADSGILLMCGETSIELAPEKLTLKAPAIEIEAAKTLECASKKGPSLSLGDKAEVLTKSFALFTESAALELDKDAKIKGAKIKLGYDPSKPSKDDKDDKGETKPLAVQLTNYLLAPYTQKKFHVIAEGLRIEGETDGEGTVRADIPKAARSAQIRLWVGDYPDGPRREYTVDFEDVKPANTVHGAKTRLKNLGYYTGIVDDLADEDYAAALGEFQADHKETHALEVTGQPDDATLGALEDVHGS